MYFSLNWLNLPCNTILLSGKLWSFAKANSSPVNFLCKLKLNFPLRPQVARAAKLVDHALQRQTVGPESCHRPAPAPAPPAAPPPTRCRWEFQLQLEPESAEKGGHLQWQWNQQGWWPSIHRVWHSDRLIVLPQIVAGLAFPIKQEDTVQSVWGFINYQAQYMPTPVPIFWWTFWNTSTFVSTARQWRKEVQQVLLQDETRAWLYDVVENGLER